jgi:hypothetical protein
MPTVPAEYRGLWRRRLFETPAGIDRDSSVYWLQTAALYADIRVPAARRSRARLAQCPESELGVLARQQGFAGILEVDGDVLHWRRWLDFQPPGALDIGRVHFADGVLVEEGVHADYREEWERVSSPGDDLLALSLEIEHYSTGSSLKRAGVLVAIDGYYMLAVARRASLPAATDLSELVVGERYPLDTRRGFLDCAIDFGLRHADGNWEVRLSTLPPREGFGFNELHGGWRTDGDDYFEQASPDGARRRWRVMERGRGFSGFPEAR